MIKKIIFACMVIASVMALAFTILVYVLFSDDIADLEYTIYIASYMYGISCILDLFFSKAVTKEMINTSMENRDLNSIYTDMILINGMYLNVMWWLSMLLNYIVKKVRGNK